MELKEITKYVRSKHSPNFKKRTYINQLVNIMFPKVQEMQYNSNLKFPNRLTVTEMSGFTEINKIYLEIDNNQGNKLCTEINSPQDIYVIKILKTLKCFYENRVNNGNSIFFVLLFFVSSLIFLISLFLIFLISIQLLFLLYQ